MAAADVETGRKMRYPLTRTSALLGAAMLTLTLPAFAQDVKIPAPASQGTGKGAPVLASLTFYGCIERESDYRAAQNKRRGGVVGTGVGVSNEFILTRATSRRATGPSESSSQPDSTYELTGPAEGEAAAFIGKRVEVSGQFQASDNSDLALRRFNVLSVRPASGSCQ